MSENAILAALRHMGYPKEEMTGHDESNRADPRESFPRSRTRSTNTSFLTTHGHGSSLSRPQSFSRSRARFLIPTTITAFIRYPLSSPHLRSCRKLDHPVRSAGISPIVSNGVNPVATTFPTERIERSIFLLRGQKVMVDDDLAELYEISVKVLNQAVKRNRSRFPEDFMFQLTAEESASLRSQNVTLKTGRGRHRKYLPFAFTEQGVAMLSSVLRSKRAVQVNVEIMRAFVRLRQMLASNAELSRKMDALEKKYDAQFKVVFDAIRQLMTPPEAKKRKIGFLVEEKAAAYGRR